jgi:hypothetical protein
MGLNTSSLSSSIVLFAFTLPIRGGSTNLARPGSRQTSPLARPSTLLPPSGLSHGWQRPKSTHTRTEVDEGQVWSIIFTWSFGQHLGLFIGLCAPSVHLHEAHVECEKPLRVSSSAYGCRCVILVSPISIWSYCYSVHGHRRIALLPACRQSLLHCTLDWWSVGCSFAAAIKFRRSGLAMQNSSAAATQRRKKKR